MTILEIALISDKTFLEGTFENICLGVCRPQQLKGTSQIQLFSCPADSFICRPQIFDVY